MAGNAARKGELPEEFSQPIRIAADIGINLGIRPLKICIRHHSRTAMSWPAHKDHVEITRFDDAVKMGVDKVKPRSGAPVTEEAWLDVIWPQRFPQQRIVQQIDLPDREEIGGSPVAIEQLKVSFSAHVIHFGSLDVQSRGRI